jgi:hypothetical protein
MYQIHEAIDKCFIFIIWCLKHLDSWPLLEILNGFVIEGSILTCAYAYKYPYP